MAVVRCEAILLHFLCDLPEAVLSDFVFSMIFVDIGQVVRGEFRGKYVCGGRSGVRCNLRKT